MKKLLRCSKVSYLNNNAYIKYGMAFKCNLVIALIGGTVRYVGNYDACLVGSNSLFIKCKKSFEMNCE